jgi:Zn-dependent protease with chaperone function
VREGLSEIMPDFSNLRQRRPPETASSSSSRSSQPPRDRSDHTHNSSIFGGWWKQQAIFSLVAVAVWFVWSGTSVSDLCLDLLVAQVPRQADVELQVQALRQQPHAYYDAYWTPLVQEIGNDLVQTLVRTCRTSSNKLHKNHKDALCRHLGPGMPDWHFSLVRDDDTVNAYCFPAGDIRLTTALVEELSPTRGEVAALLGHEMGHVLHRHATKRLLARQVGTTVQQAFFYEDDDDYEESFGEAIGELLLPLVTWLGQQRFSRRDEYQADAASWELLAASYDYQPLSLVRLLENLEHWEGVVQGRAQQQGLDGGLLESWGRTHPATPDRIASLQDRWQSLPDSHRRIYNRRLYD